MTPADLVKLARAAKSGKKVTSGLSAAKEAATISNMQQAGELPLSAAEMKRASSNVSSEDKGRKALSAAKKTLDKPRLGTWSGEDTYDIWKAKQEARMAEETAAKREEGKQQFLEPSQVKQRLYHGTNKDIEQFDPQYTGKNDFGWYGPGHYLSADPATASAYADYEKILATGKLQKEPSQGANVLPVHAQLRNPYYWPKDRPIAKTPEESVIIGNQLREQGYDGIVVSNKHQSPEYAEHHEVIVFDPKRIKSATGNRGTYDVNEPEITKAQGGLIHMSGGGTPEPKRKSILDLTPITEAAAAVQNAFKAERGTYGEKGATMDILNRGIVADTLGGAADLANLPLQGLDWLQSKIPGLSKPASVMDVPSTSPRLSDQPNTALKFPLSTDEPFGGSEAWKELFKKSGVTSKTERPVAEISTSLLAPFAPAVVGKAAKVAKAVAPRAGDLASQFINKQAEAMGLPLEMGIVPEGGAKLSKEEYAAMMREKYASQNKPKAAKAEEVKAPANDLGFYSATEKAALNLPRKSGTGDAFISDLLKQPDVSPARLDEMGITDALKGRKDVTRDEVQALVAESKIPLEESIKGAPSKAAVLNQTSNDIREILEAGQVFDDDAASFLKRWKEAKLSGRTDPQSEASLEEYLRNAGDNRTVSEVMEASEPLTTEGVAKFGPESHPDYNTPGGENYREIRIKLPTKTLSEEEARVVLGAKPDAKLTEADIAFASRKGADEFMHTSHHGNEANVLTHLRVADHVDAEGKSGLLVDELQSDWHQQGREKGYGDKLRFGYSIVEQEPGFFYLQKEGMNMPMAYGTKERIMDRAHYYNAFEKGIPDAPFKENWYQLGLKRAIKEAADTGKDRLYLTTGETQNKRYDLSKQIDTLYSGNNNDGTWTISAVKDGKTILTEDKVPQDKLGDLVGKDIAKKIIDSGQGDKFSGLDLEVGGEGMKQYYDKTYLNWLKKYAKEHGATVGETKLPGAAKKVGDLSTKERHDLLDNPEFKKTVERNVEEASLKNSNRPTMEVLSEAWDKALEDIFAQKVYYLEITPKMRKSAEKGQAYAKGGAVRMAEGGSVPKAPSNWTDYLSQHAQEESMRLMGGDTALNPMKDGGSVNLDDMIRNAVEKANARNYASGGAVNLDDLIQRAVTLRNQHA